MSKTGGGVGTNQHQIKGTGKQDPSKPPVASVGDLEAPGFSGDPIFDARHQERLDALVACGNGEEVSRSTLKRMRQFVDEQATQITMHNLLDTGAQYAIIELRGSGDGERAQLTLNDDETDFSASLVSGQAHPRLYASTKLDHDTATLLHMATGDVVEDGAVPITKLIFLGGKLLHTDNYPATSK